jgi:hypothetical protein
MFWWLAVAVADVHRNNAVAVVVQVDSAPRHFHCSQTSHTPAQLVQVELLDQTAAILYLQQLQVPVGVKAEIRLLMVRQVVRVVELVTAAAQIDLVELATRQAHHHHKETGAETTQAAQLMYLINLVAVVELGVKVKT